VGEKSEARALPWVPDLQKGGSPVRARQTVATFGTPASGLTLSHFQTQGVALGWLVKGLWPMPKNPHQTGVRLKRSTLGKSPRHDGVPLPQLLILDCIVTDHFHHRSG
jgi:hypothetical protein